MHLFVNGSAASAGGGLTYLRNVLPELSSRSVVQTTVALGDGLRSEFTGLPNTSFVSLPASRSAIARFWHEQTKLGPLIEQSGAEVLLSAGNFALRRSPIPQILLSGNSLYVSKAFVKDLRERREFSLWLDNFAKAALAKRSLAWANHTVAPTEAFAQQLRDWGGDDIKAIHHGFDQEIFFRNSNPLGDEISRKLETPANILRLLFVSHYNYYRNFETLFHAIPFIRKGLGIRKVKLFLTCHLASDKNPGSYRAELAAALVKQLNIRENVVELGAVPYEVLHGLYSACDIYTTAAYTETFAHPLVEAMACGLPVVASDIAVHREVCQDAAVYFDPFSPRQLSDQIIELANSSDIREKLRAKALVRSQDFSWRRHVDELLALANELVLR